MRNWGEFLREGEVHSPPPEPDIATPPATPMSGSGGCLHPAGGMNLPAGIPVGGGGLNWLGVVFPGA